MSRMASMQVLNNAFSNLNNAMAQIMQDKRQNRAIDIEERYKNDLLKLRQDLANRANTQDLVNLASTQGDAVANAYQQALNGDPVAQNAMLKGIEENRQRQIRNAVYDNLIGNFDKLKEWKQKQDYANAVMQYNAMKGGSSRGGGNVSKLDEESIVSALIMQGKTPQEMDEALNWWRQYKGQENSTSSTALKIATGGNSNVATEDKAGTATTPTTEKSQWGNLPDNVYMPKGNQGRGSAERRRREQKKNAEAEKRKTGTYIFGKRLPSLDRITVYGHNLGGK